MLKNLLKYVLPAVTALSLSCSPKKTDFPEGFYITPDSTDVVREERGDLEVFYARDRLLVRARNGTERSEVERIASELGGEVVGSIDALNWYELKVPDANDARDEAKKHRAIRDAELNYAGRTDGGRSNRYDIVEQSDFAEGFERIQVPEAYELLKDRDRAEEPIVAVLDSGFDMEHPELDSRYWRGIDFGDGDTNPTYTDLPDWWSSFEPPGHGTAVAGIIAAENNGQDLNGVAYNAKILPVKVISSNALVQLGSRTDPNRYFGFKVAAGIAYAAQQGAKTINISQGWEADEPSGVLEDAVEYAKEREALIIASAGNDNKDAAFHYPSSLEDVISVGATTMGDRRADFSNYSLDDSERVLAIAAPGYRIWVVEAGDHDEELALRNGSGTSYSAPFVSGLDALLVSVDSSLSARERRRIILDSADPIAVTYPEDDETHPWKRLNVYNAVVLGLTGCNPAEVCEAGMEGEGELIDCTADLLTNADFSESLDGWATTVETPRPGSCEWSEEHDGSADCATYGVVHLTQQLTGPLPAGSIVTVDLYHNALFLNSEGFGVGRSVYLPHPDAGQMTLCGGFLPESVDAGDESCSATSMLAYPKGVTLFLNVYGADARKARGRVWWKEVRIECRE